MKEEKKAERFNMLMTATKKKLKLNENKVETVSASEDMRCCA